MEHIASSMGSEPGMRYHWYSKSDPPNHFHHTDPYTTYVSAVLMVMSYNLPNGCALLLR